MASSTGLDTLSLAKRDIIERELESTASVDSLNYWNAICDETGNYLVSFV